MIPRATPKLRAPLRVVLVQASAFRRLLSRLSGKKRMAILSKNTSATALAPRVHRSIARGLVSTSSTKRTATAQAIESTSKPRAPLRVVLVQASVPRRPLPRLSGEKGMAILSKDTSATALAPLVHRSIASTSSTKRTATAQATESTSKPRAPC